MKIDSARQLQRICKELTTGGFTMSSGSEMSGVCTVPGHVGSLQVRAVIYGLGTPRAGGTVFAYRADTRRFGKAVARFSLSELGFRITNDVLDYLLDRKEAFPD